MKDRRVGKRFIISFPTVHFQLFWVPAAVSAESELELLRQCKNRIRRQRSVPEASENGSSSERLSITSSSEKGVC